METKNIEKILEACDTITYEDSYKYKNTALEELSTLKSEVERLKRSRIKRMRDLERILAEVVRLRAIVVTYCPAEEYPKCADCFD